MTRIGMPAVPPINRRAAALVARIKAPVNDARINATIPDAQAAQ